MSISSLYLFAGIVLVVLIFWDAFEVMLLPLPIRRNLRLVMLFVRYTWKSWSFIAQWLGPGDRRERLLGVYGPLSLVLLICLWVGGLILGFCPFRLPLGARSLLVRRYFTDVTL